MICEIAPSTRFWVANREGQAKPLTKLSGLLPRSSCQSYWQASLCHGFTSSWQLCWGRSDRLMGFFTLGQRDHLAPSLRGLRSRCEPEPERTDAIASTDGGCLGPAANFNTCESRFAAHTVAPAVLANLPWTGGGISDIRFHPVALKVCRKRSQL